MEAWRSPSEREGVVLLWFLGFGFGNGRQYSAKRKSLEHVLRLLKGSFDFPPSSTTMHDDGDKDEA
jgi:hypothetical protein